MIFRKCIDQNYCTFKSFYISGFKESDIYYIRCSEKMIRFIDYCKVQNDKICLTGFTSHDRICIVDGTRTYDKCFMIISAIGLDKEYNLRFLLPYFILKWDKAWVDVNVPDVESLYSKILESIELRKKI